jgi:hypothetical protein
VDEVLAPDVEADMARAAEGIEAEDVSRKGFGEADGPASQPLSPRGTREFEAG